MSAREHARRGQPGVSGTRARGGRVPAQGRIEQLSRRQEGFGAELALPRLAEIQRSRLLAAAGRAVDELGYANVTVAHITRRARVSRRTFYELFGSCEDCLLALTEAVLEDIRAEIAAVCGAELPWRERIRRGLAVILHRFDREPALARICVVRSLGGGERMLERREAILSELAGVIDAARQESARGRECVPLTAEGLVGAALTIVHARLLRAEREPLIGLLGELMGMIVLPYLGPAAARRERALAPPESLLSPPVEVTGTDRGATDPLVALEMRLTYRTARVLEAIAQRPGISNRVVGDRAGILDPGQISKLLSRLERLGLIVNGGAGHAKGEPNSWTLTVTGAEVARSIRGHARGKDRTRAA